MRRRLLRTLPVALVLALAGWVRVADHRAAFTMGELIPRLDGDSSYHLKRTLQTLEHFPRVPHWDPEMNWPKGAFCPWADGFDLGGAAFALALGGRDDPGRARLAIGLWPVVLGILAVWAAMRLAWIVAPGRAGRAVILTAGITAALVPDGVSHSLFGRVDHHVFEALVATLLAAWALRRVPLRRGHEPRVGPVLFELEGAVLSALAVYGFTGSPIYVAIVTVPLAWTAFRDGRVLPSGAAGLVAGGVLSGLLSIPAVAEHHRLWAFQLPSLLQPLLLVLAGSGIATLAWCGRAGPARWKRLGISAAVAVLVAAVAARFATGAVGEVHDAITGWLLHRDGWLATVGEFRPILSSDAVRTGWLRVYWLLGWAGFFLPVAIAVLALRAGHRSPRVAHLLGVATALAGLTLLQNRFDRVLIPVMAVVIGAVLVLVFRTVALRFRWAHPAVLAPVAVLALFVADPPTRSLRLHHGTRAPPGPWVDAALDLRDAPPPASLPRGVLTNWSYGHHVQVLANVPVVVNGFGSYLDGPEFWKVVEVFKGSEPAFDAYLADHRIGVVLAGAATIGNEVTGANESATFAGRALSEPYMTSLPLSPLLIAGSGVPDWNVAHLPHLMPRFASFGIVAELSFQLPYLWGYERVAGAEVRGRAPPGSRVVALLPFVEHRRRHVYKAWTDAGADGAWTMTLPFPSALARPTLRSDEAWRVSANGGEAIRFALPEAAVRAGATLDVGTVPGPPAKAGGLAASAR